MPFKEWPPTLYDYEVGVIVDGAVADLDMEQGRWVQCNRCGNTLKMAGPFSRSSWDTHKNTQKHTNYENAVQRGIQLSQGLLPSSQMEASRQRSSQSTDTTSTYSLADFTSVLLREARNDPQFLSLCHRGIKHTKDHESQHERQVKRVINAMTDLITDQQQDLEALQHQMNSMEEALGSFTKDMGLLRRIYPRVHGSWSSIHKQDDSEAATYERRIIPYVSAWGFHAHGVPNRIEVVDDSDDADANCSAMDTQASDIVDLPMKTD